VATMSLHSFSPPRERLGGEAGGPGERGALAGDPLGLRLEATVPGYRRPSFCDSIRDSGFAT
jgi:hypothetical protein